MLIVILSFILLMHIILCLGAVSAIHQVNIIPKAGLSSKRIWYLYFLPILGPILIAVASAIVYIEYSEYNIKNKDDLNEHSDDSSDSSSNK